MPKLLYLLICILACIYLLHHLIYQSVWTPPARMTVATHKNKMREYRYNATHLSVDTAGKAQIVSDLSHVISYSLYGSDPRYIDGALENAGLIRDVYPEWKMWIYHDIHVPRSVLSKLCGRNYVICLNMSESGIKNKMTWRFIVASDKRVDRYAVRDIDSRLSKREKLAVDDWIASGKKYHVMRDHPNHSRYTISGGLWGGIYDKNFPNIESLLLRHNPNTSRYQDMVFLKNIIWPLINTSVLQHDSFSCLNYKGSKPFPTPREGLDFVGSIYMNGTIRNRDVVKLRNARAPKECSPEVFPDKSE